MSGQFVILSMTSASYAAKVGTWAGGTKWGFTTNVNQAERFTYDEALAAQSEIQATDAGLLLVIEPAPPAAVTQ